MTDASPPPVHQTSAVELRLNALIVLGLLAIGALLYSLFGPPPTAKWEYMIVAPSDAALQGQLDKLGAEGWEVVAARRATSGYGDYATASYELILKRRGTAPSAQSLGAASPGAVSAPDMNTANMKADLRNLVTAQEAYFADNVTYAASVNRLNYTVSPGTTVTILSSSGTGWSATASNVASKATCGIFVGSAQPPFPGQAEGAPQCQ